MYLDNYAGHMRNFMGSVDCWGFKGGKVKPFYHATTMTRERRGVKLEKMQF